MTAETRLELLRELRLIQAEYPFVRVLANFLLEGQFGAQTRVNEIQNALLADPAPVPDPDADEPSEVIGAGTPLPDPIPEAE